MQKFIVLLGLIAVVMVFAGTASAANPNGNASVQLTNTVSNSTPNVGQQFNYTIIAANNGPDNATGLQVTDNVPAGLILNNYTVSPGTTYDNATGIWNIGVLTKGVNASLYLYVTPTASVAGQNTTNTATKISEDQFDSSPLTAKVGIHVPESNVVLTKSASNSTPNVGDPFIYTITATNYGPDNADGLQVTDIIPFGLTYNGYTASQGTNYINNTWYIGTLPNGTTAWLNLNVTPNAIVAENNVTNTITKTSETTYDPSPTTASITVYIPESNVVLTKTTSNTMPNVGQQYTYTVTALNNGPDNATDLQVTDNIPSGLNLNGYTSTPGTSYDYGTGVWNIGTLQNGSSVYLYLSVVPTASVAGQTVTNTANKTSEDQYDPQSNSSTVNVKVPSEANVVLTKTVSNAMPNVNQQYTYTVSAVNNGPDNATGLQITDNIPSGLTLNSYTYSPGTIYNNVTGVWYIGTLANGTTDYLILNVTPTATVAGQNVMNNATKTSETIYDPSPISSSVNVYVPESEVVLTKTVNNTTPNVGQQYTYMLSAVNNGPDTATDLQVTDNIPSGLTLNNYTASQGTTYNNATGVWNIGTLLNNENASLILYVTPKTSVGGSNITNTAIIICEDQYDPSTDTAIVTVHVPESNVVLTKTVSNTAPNVGQQYTYTVTAMNNGPDTATGLQVTDNIPSGLTLNNYTASPGTTYNNGVWSIGTLQNGANATLILYVTPTGSVAGQTVTNTANKTSEDQYDPQSNSSSVDVKVTPSAYVVITKTTSNTTPNVGQQYTYTINATNYSTITATGLQVTDKLPSGLTLNSYTVSPGTTYNNVTGVWSIGTLQYGSNASLILYVTPTASLAGFNVTNTATKTNETTNDPAPETISVIVHVPKAHVLITKTTSNTTPNVGQQYTYTVTAANNGPDNATGLQVTDIIPSGLTLNNYTASPGTTYNNGVWSIGTLQNNTNATLILYVTPTASLAGQNITNTATKTSEDQYDTATKTSSVKVKVPVEAYAVLTNTASTSKPTVGQKFTYTLKVTNYSPYTATGLQVTDKIPSGLTLNSYTVSSGTTYNNVTGVWKIGTLSKNMNASLILYVTPKQSAAGFNITNTATKTNETTYDPASKTASVTVHVNYTVTISQLATAANTIKTYYENHNSLPNNVVIGNQNITMSQFLQLLVTATLNLNNGVTTPILVQNVNPATNPAGTIQAGSIQKSEYLSIAQKTQSFINSNSRAPNFANSSLGDITFNKLVYMFSKIVNYYNVYNRLPNLVSMN